MYTGLPRKAVFRYYIPMAKSKTPGNLQTRGIAAYQKTLAQSPQAAPKKAPQKKSLTKEPARIDNSKTETAKNHDRNIGGLLKTTKTSKKLSKTKPNETKLPKIKTPLKSGKAVKAPAPVRTVPELPPKGLSGPDLSIKESESKTRRVAKFLILIGSKEASAILAKLDKAQVEEISKEIVSIKGITAEETDAILQEFRGLFATSYGFTGTAEGGVEAARRILHTAYGQEKGEALLRKAVPDSMENPLSFLEDFTGEQVAFLLRNETPAVMALVLSRLSPQITATALANIRTDQKADIVRRIAKRIETSPQVLEQVAASLREKARFVAASPETADIDGRSALTAILKHSDSGFGDRMLRELEDRDPDLGREIKERLHTLEDVVLAENKPLQEKLRSMEDKEIALLLKGKSKEFATKIYFNLSSGRRAIVMEEGEFMGAAIKRDVDAVTSSFMDWFRLGREEGRILLSGDDDIIE